MNDSSAACVCCHPEVAHSDGLPDDPHRPCLTCDCGGYRRPAQTQVFEVERQEDGSWYATYRVGGEAKAGSGRHPSPLDALKAALPVGLFSEEAN